MAIQNFFTSRDNNLDGNTYVGQLGRLWYNPDTNSLYASDGNTVGGVPVDLATGANASFSDISANSITANFGTLNIDGSLNVTGNVIFTGNISPAGANKIGGIVPGPGVVVSAQGELTIDAANLPLSFGNFTASNNILTIVNADEDMVLATSGNAEIQLIGNIGFYKPDGLPPDVGNRYFFASSDGQISVLVPDVDPAAGAVKIIGSTSGQEQSPINSGVMLQITGQNNLPSRLYNDAIANYSAFISRRYNGTAASPSQVLINDEISRYGVNAYRTGGWLNIGQARISFISTDNQDANNNGTRIDFYSTPRGNTTANITRVLSLDASTGANVTGNVNVTQSVNAQTTVITGNVTGGNLTTQGQVSAQGNIVTVANVSAQGNITSGFFVGNGVYITGINAYGNVYANGVAVTATSGSASLTLTPANNINITGNNGTKAVSIAVNDSPSFTGTVTVGGNIRFDQAVNNATGNGFNKTGGTVTANGRTGQLTTNADRLAKGAAGTFTINNTYITSARDLVVVNIASGASINSYALAVTAVNATGYCDVTVTNNGAGPLAEALVINFGIIKVS